MPSIMYKAHPELCAIVLAAGESRRMGTPKMLLPIGGMTMIERVISNIKSGGLNLITVVLGAIRDELIEKVEQCGVSYCINENYREGMLSSVICGLDNTDDELAVMIFPGDQPLIKPETINLVTGKFLNSHKGLAVATCKKRRGHPLVIHPRYRDEIRKLDQSKGLRELLEKHPDDILEVEADDRGILKDFDTFEEYLKEINQTP